MTSPEHRIAFGPVPSRRLGQSLGINNVITKTCSYACIYCQVGATTDQTIDPRHFFTPEQVQAAVSSRLQKLTAAGVKVDYLTFVPDGEPTLDIQLGANIDALRLLGSPVAVITNASLLWREDVRHRLGRADLVSVKVDTVDDAIWRRINRPHRELDLVEVLDGIRAFAIGYRGTLITDTMLIAAINDTSGALAASADFIAGIQARVAYLALPTRPTTVAGLRGTDEAGLLRAHQIFSARLPRVELLAEHETGDFAHTGDARDDLLAVTAVHPMREDDVRRLLAEDHAEWSLVQSLLSEGSLKAVEYLGETFYLRPVCCAQSMV
jgi:wyosine [tRNA(Phe)-imidazoG37] synthetase (radical SAM superfamily)